MTEILDTIFVDHVNWFAGGRRCRRKARHQRSILRHVLRELTDLFAPECCLIALYGAKMYLDVYRILDCKIASNKNRAKALKLSQLAANYMIAQRKNGIGISIEAQRTLNPDQDFFSYVNRFNQYPRECKKCHYKGVCRTLPEHLDCREVEEVVKGNYEK